jgi:hypothetical protein
VLFAKLIPADVEGTMFAFVTSILNASFEFGAKGLGLLINHFVGVTTENLENYWILVVI